MSRLRTHKQNPLVAATFALAASLVTFLTLASQAAAAEVKKESDEAQELSKLIVELRANLVPLGGTLSMENAPRVCYYIGRSEILKEPIDRAIYALADRPQIQKAINQYYRPVDFFITRMVAACGQNLWGNDVLEAANRSLGRALVGVELLAEELQKMH